MLPLVEEYKPLVSDDLTTAVSYKPGRNKASGAPAAPVPKQSASSRSAIKSFRPVSLLAMIRATGRVPEQLSSTGVLPLEELRLSAQRPIVVFPECTTSNGRGLLRFAEVFEGVKVPVKQFNVFIMCIR